MGRLDRALENEVVQRARGLCEYCHFPVSAAEIPFHIDHIVAEKHGGPTTSGNLAWACFSCNLRKGPNIAGLDPVTGDLTRLFHPRTDVWTEHFFLGWCMRGKTPVGRTTIAVLDINDADAVAVRQALRDEGVFQA
jgi:hypothetical protein